MLTKEECQKALDHFEKCYWDQDNSYGAMNGVRKDLDILNKLIHEHFDNPPLGFEELIKHKVVWDNEIKEFAFVLEQYKPTILNVPAPSDLRAISLEYRGGEIECLLSEKVEETINDYYSPNRFYRKEVQE